MININSILGNIFKENNSENNNLEKLKTICSTGSPLSNEGFKYVYQNIKKNVHLASIAGGTDLVSCFVLGNIYSPVFRGQIQNNGLGMNTDHTLEEVGLQFSVTRERIRQIEAKALRKFKHPSRSKQLKSFLEK